MWDKTFGIATETRNSRKFSPAKETSYTVYEREWEGGRESEREGGRERGREGEREGGREEGEREGGREGERDLPFIDKVCQVQEGDAKQANTSESEEKVVSIGDRML